MTKQLLKPKSFDMTLRRKGPLTAALEEAAAALKLVELDATDAVDGGVGIGIGDDKRMEEAMDDSALEVVVVEFVLLVELCETKFEDEEVSVGESVDEAVEEAVEVAVEEKKALLLELDPEQSAP